MVCILYRPTLQALSCLTGFTYTLAGCPAHKGGCPGRPGRQFGKHVKLVSKTFTSPRSKGQHVGTFPLTLKGPGIFTVFHVGVDLKLQIGM